jgi:hypothetical protein
MQYYFYHGYFVARPRGQHCNFACRSFVTHRLPAATAMHVILSTGSSQQLRAMDAHAHNVFLFVKYLMLNRLQIVIIPDMIVACNNNNNSKNNKTWCFAAAASEVCCCCCVSWQASHQLACFNFDRERFKYSSTQHSTVADHIRCLASLT